MEKKLVVWDVIYSVNYLGHCRVFTRHPWWMNDVEAISALSELETIPVTVPSNRG